MASTSIPEKEVEVVSADNENLKKFCDPVDLCIFLQNRLKTNPIFHQRCLNYKIKAKREKESESSGTVVFNYVDPTGKRLASEFVKNFACPICSIPCTSKDGMRLHIQSSHDFLDFKFWEPAVDYPEVDVFVKPNACEFGEQTNAAAKMYKDIPYSFCVKGRKLSQKPYRKNKKHLSVKFMKLSLGGVPRRRTGKELSNVNVGNNMKQPNVGSMELDLCGPPRVMGNELANVNDSNMKLPNIGSLVLDLNDLPRDAGNEVANVNGGTIIATEKSREIQTSTIREVGESSKRKKGSLARKQMAAKRAEITRVSRLKSRQFYHSQTYQPMTLEKVMSDADSEDEPDDEDAYLDERLWINELGKVSDEEKRYMHLWNIFARKQKVVADGHTPWGCEHFTKLHAKEMNTSLSFFWWWKHFQIHLWKLGLITGITIDKCTTILENSESAAGPSTSRGPGNGK